MDELEMKAFELELRLTYRSHWFNGTKRLYWPEKIARMRERSRTYRPPIHQLPPESHYVLP